MVCCVNVGRGAKCMVAGALVALLAACGSDQAGDQAAQTLARTGLTSPAAAAHYTWASQPLQTGVDGRANRRIVVLDPAQQVVRVIDTDVAAQSVMGGRAVAVSADGQTLTTLGDSALYYLRGGQLHALDLSRTGGLSDRVVSTMLDACSIEKVEPLANAGTTHWVAVQRGSPEGACGGLADSNGHDERYLIRSDLSPLDAPATRVDGWGGVAGFHRDRQGRLTHALVWDLTNRELTLVSPSDGTRRGLGVIDPMGSFGQIVSPLAQGNPDVTVVQIGSEWRALLWQGDVAQWASVPAGNLEVGSNPFMTLFAADEEATFLADGRMIKRIDAHGMGSTWLTLPSERGAWISGLALTPTHVLVIQSDGSSFWLEAIRRSDRHIQTINTDGLINEPQLAQTNGNTVILQEPDGQWTYRLWRLDLAGTALLKELASGVLPWVVSAEPVTKVGGGSADTAQMAWVTLNDTRSALKAETLTFYDLRTQRLTHPAALLRGQEWAHFSVKSAPALSSVLMTQEAGAVAGADAPRRWWWLDAAAETLGPELSVTP